MQWKLHVRARLGERAIDVAIEGDATPLALLGPNGAGKTSLLRMFAGAHRPESGSIRVGDRDLFDSARSVNLPPEQRDVGYVPQGCGLFSHLRVIDNVAFGLSTGARRVPKKERRDRAVAMLEELDCAHLEARFPSELSGGERQRVALARALITNPSMLLLDEPFSAMDAGARRQLRATLTERLRRLSLPTILVTHNLQDVLTLGARACMIEEGRVIQEGRVEALAASPATEFVSELFATLRVGSGSKLENPLQLPR